MRRMTPKNVPMLIPRAFQILFASSVTTKFGPTSNVTLSSASWGRTRRATKYIAIGKARTILVHALSGSCRVAVAPWGDVHEGNDPPDHIEAWLDVATAFAYHSSYAGLPCFGRNLTVWTG